MKGDLPLPDPDFEGTREFWQAAARDVLAIPRCGSCGRFQWYPRESCPACEAVEWSWTAMSGRGSLYSWAVVRRALARPFATKVPYVPGLVALEEDPAVRIVTNLVDCNPDDLQMDMPVRVVFRPLSFPGSPREVRAPMFTPSDVHSDGNPELQGDC